MPLFALIATIVSLLLTSDRKKFPLMWQSIEFYEEYLLVNGSHLLLYNTTFHMLCSLQTRDARLSMFGALLG